MIDPSHLAFLREHHAEELGHSGHSLLDHLTGTHQLLETWGADPEGATAGLFHSVYGTESFRAATVPLGLRPRVRTLIGERAEHLAYVFGAMEKATFEDSVFRGRDFAIGDRHTGETHALDEPAFRDFAAVVTANWLEQKPRMAEKYQQYKADLFAAVRSYLAVPAAAALTASYAFED